MFPIVRKQKIAENTYLMEIEAPLIAKKAQPGQFIMLRIDESGERIPLTIADFDKKNITIVFLAVGKTTEQLALLRKGDGLLDVAGPLGNKSEMATFGVVCLVGGGLGIAPIYPIARALKKEKNYVITIIGAKSKEYLFWEDKLKEFSDSLIICTDNGSKGRKGFVTNALKELMEHQGLTRVITIGPPIMMKMVSDLTKDRVKTIASLNPIMIDGIGMCGGCRVVVDGIIRFACCDGPEFNAHRIDWNEMMNRNKAFIHEEGLCRNIK